MILIIYFMHRYTEHNNIAYNNNNYLAALIPTYITIWSKFLDFFFYFITHQVIWTQAIKLFLEHYKSRK